jgi:hypothetical protein
MTQPINLAQPIDMANLSPGNMAALRAFQGKQEVVTNWPYWSRVRFNTILTGGGALPSVYTIPAGTEITAFGYALKQDMSAAGRPGVTATLADTNLQSQGETIGGQDLYIRRIGLMLNSTSEAQLALNGSPEISVRVSLDGGQTTFNMGTMTMLPGGGGLFGAEASATAAQPLPGGRPQVGALNNGWPVERNQAGIPETLVWKRKSYPDSNLAIILRAERAIVVTTQLPDEAAVAGIRGYVNPPASAVFLDLTVQVKAQVRSQRSANA